MLISYITRSFCKNKKGKDYNEALRKQVNINGTPNTEMFNNAISKNQKQGNKLRSNGEASQDTLRQENCLKNQRVFGGTFKSPSQQWKSFSEEKKILFGEIEGMNSSKSN